MLGKKTGILKILAKIRSSLRETKETHRSVGSGEEEDEEDDDDDDEEATTNKTDRKWIHDDEVVFDGDDDCDEDVWLRRRALINGFCSVSISTSTNLILPN